MESDDTNLATLQERALGNARRFKWNLFCVVNNVDLFRYVVRIDSFSFSIKVNCIDLIFEY